MKKILHKLFFKISMAITVIAVFIVILNVFARSITSQVPVTNVNMNVMRNKAAESMLNDPKNSKTATQKILIGMYRTFSCGIMGQSCYKPSKDDVSNSLLGRLGNVSTVGLKNPPASGTQEVYRTFANAGLAPKTYAAQGIGFGAIAGFRPVWKIFRDIAYGILVLVMVAISFMIMFRMKLNAQTAISIESALPRIVLSLILITFSYALAGFLIDLMYVFMGVVITLLCGNNTFCDASAKTNEYLNAGMANVWQGFFPYQGAGGSWQEYVMMIFMPTQAGKAIFHLSNSLVAILPNALQAAIIFIGGIVNLLIVNFIVTLGTNSQFFELTKNFQALTFSFGGLPPALIGGLTVTILMSLTFITTPLFITLIIFLTLIFLFFRIFFMLVSTYLNLIFMILFAPVYMLFEAIPGQNSFSYWIKNMIGELITFPLLAVFLMVGALIVNNFQTIDQPGVVEWGTKSIWQPPFLSGWSGGLEQQSFLMVIGMGIIFIIPDLIKMVKETLGVKPPPVNIGLGTFLAGGALAWGGGMGLMNSAFKWSGMIYGNDEKGRNAGIQGKMTRMFSPMKEAFVKRSKPGDQVNQGPTFNDYEKQFVTRNWDKQVNDQGQWIDATGNVVSSPEKAAPLAKPIFTRSAEGRKHEEALKRTAKSHYDAEKAAAEAKVADLQQKEAYMARQTQAFEEIAKKLGSQPQAVESTPSKPASDSTAESRDDNNEGQGPTNP